MAQETSGYWRAEEVLPVNLIEEVSRILTTSTKITFAPTHKALNRSESALPDTLVYKCRDALDRKGVDTRRIVLFRSRKDHDGGPNHAIVLAKRGFPPKVIADALNYNPRTMSRWGLKEHLRDEAAAVERTEEALSAGFIRFQALHPGDEADVTYYQLLGTAVRLMETKEYQDEVVKLFNDQRATARPKRW